MRLQDIWTTFVVDKWNVLPVFTDDNLQCLVELSMAATVAD